MNNSPPPIDPQQSPASQTGTQAQKSKGCLFGGMGCGLGCLLVLAIFIGLSAFVVVKVNHFIAQSTSAPPLEAPVATSDEIQASVNKFHRLLSADNTEPFSFTDRELNIVLANDPIFEKIADKVQVEINRDVFIGKFSVAADDLPIPDEEFPPFLKGRNLNGKVSLTAYTDHNQLTAQLKGIEVNGFSVPTIFLSRYQTINLFDRVKEKPEGKEALDKLESVRVEDGKIWIVPKPKS